MMTELSRTHDEEVGDGITSIIVLVGEMLYDVKAFIDKKYHIPEIVYIILGSSSIAQPEVLGLDFMFRDLASTRYRFLLSIRFSEDILSVWNRNASDNQLRQPAIDTNSYNVFIPREKAHRLHKQRMQRRKTMCNHLKSFVKLDATLKNEGGNICKLPFYGLSRELLLESQVERNGSWANYRGFTILARSQVRVLSRSVGVSPVPKGKGVIAFWFLTLNSTDLLGYLRIVNRISETTANLELGMWLAYVVRALHLCARYKAIASRALEFAGRERGVALSAVQCVDKKRISEFVDSIHENYSRDCISTKLYGILIRAIMARHIFAYKNEDFINGQIDNHALANMAFIPGRNPKLD
ncbi:T-complex protein 1 subunit gamma [Tanacetum coccineum]